MKKTFLSTAAIVCFFYCIAQDSSKTYLPKAGSIYNSFGAFAKDKTYYYSDYPVDKGTFFCRKYKENSFSQYGIFGSINKSSNPEIAFNNIYHNSFDYFNQYYFSTYAQSVQEGIESSFSYLNISPGVMYGYAKRIKINDRIESFAGVNFSLSYNYYRFSREYTLEDSASINWNFDQSPFNSGSYNDDSYKNTLTQSVLGLGANPFVGANYFITEKLAVGGYYQFDGLSVIKLVSGEETLEIIDRGKEQQYGDPVYKNNPGANFKLEFTGSAGIFFSYAIK